MAAVQITQEQQDIKINDYMIQFRATPHATMKKCSLGSSSRSCPT